MVALDWVFSKGEGGGVRIVIFGGLLGMITLGLLLPSAYEQVESRQNKYYFVLLGLPIWLGIRAAYWSVRAQGLREMARRKDRELAPQLESLFKHNDRLWHEVIRELPGEMKRDMGDTESGRGVGSA